MRIGYLRISNKDESDIEQIAALSMASCDRVVEERSTHALKERPELDKALAEMQQGDTLVVWGFERLACSVGDLQESIALLHEREISLHSLKEAFISTHPDAAPKIEMLRQVAEFKAFIDSEKSAFAKKVMKEKGISNGSERKLSDRDMNLIFALIDEGIAKSTIAKKFNVSEKTLYQTLRDPRYMGEVIMRPRRNPALKERLKTAKEAPTPFHEDTD